MMLLFDESEGVVRNFHRFDDGFRVLWFDHECGRALPRKW